MAVLPGDDRTTADPSTTDSNWRVATRAQQGIWVLDRSENLRPTYLIPSVVEFTDPVDHDILVQSTQRVFDRHPALRSRFRLNTKMRRVEYCTDDAAAEVGFIDAASEGWQREELDRLVKLLCCTPFDLAEDPPVRAEVIRVDERTTLLVVTVHHIACDGWSRALLMSEIAQNYRDMASGLHVDRGEATHPADVLTALTADEITQRLPEVVERLQGAPIDVHLPFDRKPGDDDFIGATVSVEVGEDATGRILALSAETGCTLFMTGMALLAAGLARTGPQRDFLFAFGWPGREHPDAAEVIGMFMSTVILRIGLDENTTWRELLRTARLSGMDAFIDSDVPLDAIAAALNPDREVVWPPLSPVLLNLDDAPRALDLVPGLSGRYRPIDPLYVKYDLALFIRVDEGPGAGRLHLSLDYPVALFDEAAVTDFLMELRRCAIDLADHPEEPVIEPASTAHNLDDPAARLDLLRSLWREVLSVDNIGDDVSFFDAGGDSLLLVVLVERLSQVSGRPLKTIDIFRAGTIRGQAELLAGPNEATPGGAAKSSRDRLLGAARNSAAGGRQ